MALATAGIVTLVVPIFVAVVGVLAGLASQIPCAIAALIVLGLTLRGGRRRRSRVDALPLPPSSAEERAPSSAVEPSAQRPAQVADWLRQQRPVLPGEAHALVDRIAAQLESIAAQPGADAADNPAARELSVLIEEELPQLVRAYSKVPETLRRRALHGRETPQQQLCSGLATLEQQLIRAHELLATPELEALAIHQRYLDLKYKRDDES